MLITSSNAETAFDNYAKSKLASVDFYRQLMKERRIHVILGRNLLSILRILYRRSHLTPQKFQLRSVPGWINSGQVHVGIVKTTDISNLYKEHGDSLFFENLREFLGLDKASTPKDRDYVNTEIVATLTDKPHKMLAKNNGITIRASEVHNIDEHVIDISSGAIVNGCQATNCVFIAPESQVAEVLVKVVISEDGWDVAQSANYQNQIARIDLEIAKYVRPALIQKYAASIGYSIKSELESESSVSGIVGKIYANMINYDAIRTLFVGIFSRKRNNMFQNNYTEISKDLVERVFSKIDVENDIFRVLFIAITAGDQALRHCEAAALSGDSSSNSECQLDFSMIVNAPTE